MIDIEAAFAEPARKECRRIGQAIVDEIRENPHTPYDPFDPGTHLRDSYHVVETARGADVRSTKSYWAYVEYGHRDVAWGHNEHRWIPGQPHVRPAVEVVRAANTG